LAEKERAFLVFSFMIVTIFTAIIVVLANIGVFGEQVRISDFATKWGTVVVLGEIVAATLTAFKYEVFSKSMIEIVFVLSSPEDVPVDADLVNLEEGKYQMFDNRGEIISEEKILPIRLEKSDEWGCHIGLSKIESAYVTRIVLKDEEGNEWKTEKFQTALQRHVKTKKGVI